MGNDNQDNDRRHDQRRAVDRIDHPPHYNHGTIEPVDVIEDWRLGFHLGNSLKYISRADHKGNRLEDLKKAAWYLAREIENEERRAAERSKLVEPLTIDRERFLGKTDGASEFSASCTERRR